MAKSQRRVVMDKLSSSGMCREISWCGSKGDMSGFSIIDI